jgi:hypothetical protein
MEIHIHSLSGVEVAEIFDGVVLVRQERDAITLFEEIFAYGARAAILRKEQFAAEFFDLSSGLAGAVLQKFSNYRIQLAIVGDFSTGASKSLQAFIYESNKGNQVFFVDSLQAALDRLRAS